LGNFRWIGLVRALGPCLAYSIVMEIQDFVFNNDSFLGFDTLSKFTMNSIIWQEIYGKNSEGRRNLSG
jgi:hypothetical protein